MSWFVPSECYIGHVLNTITSEFRDVPGFKLMRNIIPKGSWPQKQSGRSRSAAKLHRRAVIFAIIYIIT